MGDLQNKSELQSKRHPQVGTGITQYLLLDKTHLSLSRKYLPPPFREESHIRCGVQILRSWGYFPRPARGFFFHRAHLSLYPRLKTLIEKGTRCSTLFYFKVPTWWFPTSLILSLQRKVSIKICAGETAPREEKTLPNHQIFPFLTTSSCPKGLFSQRPKKNNHHRVHPIIP